MEVEDDLFVYRGQLYKRFFLHTNKSNCSLKFGDY